MISVSMSVSAKPTCYNSCELSLWNLLRNYTEFVILCQFAMCPSQYVIIVCELSVLQYQYGVPHTPVLQFYQSYIVSASEKISQYGFVHLG